MDKIRVLQIGTQNWASQYEIPEYVDWTYGLVEDKDGHNKAYDLVLIDGKINYKDLDLLRSLTDCHRLYYTRNAEGNMALKKYVVYVKEKMGQLLDVENAQVFISHEIRNYFHAPYGEKYRPFNMAINHMFQGRVKWDGSYAVELEGHFGTDYRQIAYWRNNIPVFQGQAIDLWLEYEKVGQIEIYLQITQFRAGSTSDIQNEWCFTEEQMQDIVYIDNLLPEGPIFVSLFAKGEGLLKIIALHDRYSRRGHGMFLPGGERYVTSKREEVFCYFEPGDMKPPLNVYFSGYKTMEGFEGLNMMRRLGCPFLLVAEARLEGGSFYMGSEEYEDMFLGMIQKYVDLLGFRSNQVILAGLSMGTYGALYYGCDLKPKAVLLGKPLASVGNIAANEKYLRPGGFATSLDVLHVMQNSLDGVAIEQLNNKFWDKFRNTEWDDTKFVVSYMYEDDYDSDAYKQLIHNLHGSGVQLYGKGIHGRHNDDTPAVVAWFENQFRQILYEDFDRRRK